MIGDQRLRDLERAARQGDLAAAYGAMAEIVRRHGPRAALRFGLEVTRGRVGDHPPLEQLAVELAPSLVEATEQTSLESASDEDLQIVYELYPRLYGDTAAELRPLNNDLRYERVGREINRRMPDLPVMVRVWQDPAEDRRRLRLGEAERFWIDNHREYDLDKAEGIIRELGGKIAPRSRSWGEWSGQPSVVFSGVPPREVERALNVLPGNFRVLPKTWGGDALPELRHPPTLLLLFPTEFAAPPDECESVFWREVVPGGWDLADHGAADAYSIIRDTRPATPEQAAPAISTYQVQTGRRLRLYARMQSSFRRLRQQQARGLR